MLYAQCRSLSSRTVFFEGVPLPPDVVAAASTDRPPISLQRRHATTWSATTCSSNCRASTHSAARRADTEARNGVSRRQRLTSKHATQRRRALIQGSVDLEEWNRSNPTRIRMTGMRKQFMRTECMFHELTSGSDDADADRTRRSTLWLKVVCNVDHSHPVLRPQLAK